MPMVRLSRRAKVCIIAILGLTIALVFFERMKSAETRRNASLAIRQHERIGADQHKMSSLQKRPVVPWPEWGGALNSARENGFGFFKRTQRQEFTAWVQPMDRKYIIDLNSRAILPLIADRNLGEVFPNASQSGSETAYLQFMEHPTEAQRRQLAVHEIELLSYVTGYAWVARGKMESFEKILNEAWVRGLARIDPRDKLQQAVYEEQTPDYALDGEGRTQWVLVAAAGTKLRDLEEELSKLDGFAAVKIREGSPSVLGPRFEIVLPVEKKVVDLNDLLLPLLRSPHAPREEPATPFADNHNNNVGPVLPGPLPHAEREDYVRLAIALARLDLVSYVEYAPPPVASRDATTDEQSNVIDVRDNPSTLSGLGIKVAVREIGKMDAHVDFASRLQYVDSNGDSATVNVDHATAVTGQIGSAGTAQPAAKGVAPGVSMLGYSLAGTNESFAITDITDAASKGARISNHSYGPANLSTFGDYQTISADWDGALRSNNAVGAFAGNEEPGSTAQRIDFFVGAKNTICVAASNANAHAGDLSPLTSKSDGITSFSHSGPMNDGRIKPDLVAFGESVSLDKGTSGLQSVSGTSFSTPAVIGVMALLFQEYKVKLGVEPSAAMGKAILCNSATDLGLSGPDAVYGFGLVNAEAAIKTADLFVDTSKSPFFEGTASNKSVENFTVAVEDLTQLKLTLCWMDVAGDPKAARALVNDLDLEVIAPDGSTTSFPFSLNASSPASAATNTGPNRVDPIEQVVVNAPANGNWTVYVKGFSIPNGDQSFAVCLNVQKLPPLIAAVILASPTEGPAQLEVSFSGAKSTGTSLSYEWDFGDGSEDEGVDVEHVYTSPGMYTVKLTIITIDNVQKTSTVLITAGKNEVSAFVLRATARLDFQKPERDKFQFTLIAPELVMTPQEARESLRDGAFEGISIKVSIGENLLATGVLDSRASFKSDKVGIRLIPSKGEIVVQLTQEELGTEFQKLGMTEDPTSSGFHDVTVSIETDDAIYSATMKLLYKNTSGKAGTAKK